jgi:hypothetical protein
MDPISGTLGVVAGVTSIVSVIGKSVAALNQVRLRYRDAELNIALLTGQLRIVQTALLQVQRWAECLPGDPQHYQLMIDLQPQARRNPIHITNRRGGCRARGSVPEVQTLRSEATIQGL